jgi:hypothetical protein
VRHFSTRISRHCARAAEQASSSIACGCSVGRLDIAPEELEGRNQRSALFKTMFLAFRAAEARDWHSNLAIALGHRGAQHRLQFLTSSPRPP